MQNKRGLIFVAQSKLIAFYWKTWTFHGLGQTEQPFGGVVQMMIKLGCASAAHAASARLRSSHGVCLSLRSTAHFFFCNIALDTIYRGLKVKRNCLYIRSHC